MILGLVLELACAVQRGCPRSISHAPTCTQVSAAANGCSERAVECLELVWARPRGLVRVEPELVFGAAGPGLDVHLDRMQVQLRELREQRAEEPERICGLDRELQGPAVRSGGRELVAVEFERRRLQRVRSHELQERKAGEIRGTVQRSYVEFDVPGVVRRAHRVGTFDRNALTREPAAQAREPTGTERPAEPDAMAAVF